MLCKTKDAEFVYIILEKTFRENLCFKEFQFYYSLVGLGACGRMWRCFIE